jgi:hypothetical protein
LLWSLPESAKTQQGYNRDDMPRVIDPPRNKFNKLLTPLTDGERRVIELFDAHLLPEWEIYIQPHLNGLRPDIVLLHPGVGVAVFEVKDWDLGAMQYYAEPDGLGHQVLMARDKMGKTFSRESDNPINKILLYKDELFSVLAAGRGRTRIWSFS